MGKIFGAIAKVGIAGMGAYALYLAYKKFVDKSEDSDELIDDGFDFGTPGESLSFTDRVKKAAQRQLDKM